VLLWKRYDNNKMEDMCYYGNVILHLQQYSHRLNLFNFFFMDRRTNSDYFPIHHLTGWLVQCVPLDTEPGISLIILTPMKI